MKVHAFVAGLSFDPRLLNQQWLLTVVVGVIAGLGVVAVLHFLIRPRITLVPIIKGRPQNVADPFVHGSATENRKSFRREGNPVEILIINAAVGPLPIKGYVVDRCMGGLGLFLEVPVQPGQQLTVRPTNAPSITPWVEVIVKSCRASNPGHELGCQFVKTPPWAVLLMFG